MRDRPTNVLFVSDNESSTRAVVSVLERKFDEAITVVEVYETSEFDPTLVGVDVVVSNGLCNEFDQYYGERIPVTFIRPFIQSQQYDVPFARLTTNKLRALTDREIKRNVKRIAKAVRAAG